MADNDGAEATDATPPTIFAGPTKRFFISMFTRDIELKDAILDMLDNCVDGAMRHSGRDLTGDMPYDGYWAKIVASPASFEMTDNCGGIPRDIAKGSAFRLGRPDMERDKALPTIGMYGIGMKRAIFKLGRDAKIHSQPDEGPFLVHYDKAWMDEDNEAWDLPIDWRPAARPDGIGTTITVTDLLASVKEDFSADSPFLEELGDAISTYYGYIISKGFSVELNGKAVDPKILSLFSTDDIAQDGMAPYLLQGELDDVRYVVAVGFRRPLATETELDDEQDAPRTSDDAGITIICNDRVVTLNDKGRLTGWGDNNVPKYHNQFIAIGGSMSFISNNASKLPLTTTKRGVDAATEVYLTARTYAMEGLKGATAFTNKWKGMEEETEKFFQSAKPMTVSSFEKAVTAELRDVREVAAKRFSPKLPMPPAEKPTRRVSFTRTAAEIAEVAEYLFDDKTKKPGEVGGECFDYVLKEARA